MPTRQRGGSTQQQTQTEGGSAFHSFLVYHTRKGRTRFVDQVFVSRRRRRGKVGTFLLHHICKKGPVELIARKENSEAISMYSKVGFCVLPEKGSYPPSEDELFMRTSSYIRSRGLMEERTRGEEAPHMEEAKWGSLSQDRKRRMVDLLEREEGMSRKTALSLIHPDDNVEFVFVY